VLLVRVGLEHLKQILLGKLQTLEFLLFLDDTAHDALKGLIIRMLHGGSFRQRHWRKGSELVKL
jgi:hypothetical protein